MELKGSCHCEKVRFTVTSHTPYPYLYCYCSICRKCQGGGGYSINIRGQYDTLKVEGKEYLKGYQALKDKKTKESCIDVRYFCGECGSHVYQYDPNRKDWVFPFAGAIDTPLPEVKEDEINYIFLDSKSDWVPAPKPGSSKNVYLKDTSSPFEIWHKENNHYIE